MQINYDLNIEDYSYENRNADAPKTIYDLAHHISNNVNGGYLGSSAAFGKGLGMGLYLRREHRTLQGCIINFLLGVICGLANQEYTDLRNEEGVKSCKKIRDMIESEDIHRQPFI